MPFNSYPFLLVFLPLVLAGNVRLLRRYGRRAAMGFLSLASLFFYGFWNPSYLGLLGLSVLGNFTLGRALSAGRARGGRARGGLLALGVGANLALLAYFKYGAFIADIAELPLLRQWFAQVVLPLGISFITFQKIAYLVDAYRGETVEHDFSQFCCFVLFFPQLIAGPIAHHSEIIPQLQRESPRFDLDEVCRGLSLLSFGLFKKVVIADQLAVYASQMFDAAALGRAPDLVQAWGGTVSYGLQLYFDFSGYSDMAIGLGWLFGIKLPSNFDSPYQATSIVDFWRRWHITLSRFLRDYLYIPLGGNRHGPLRRYANVLLTMTLGGLWHGASWTFVAWGALHGLYLIVNHGFRAATRGFRWLESPRLVPGYRLLTFASVSVAWVLFRAPSFTCARTVWAGMAGLNGASLPPDLAMAFIQLFAVKAQFAKLIFPSAGLVWLAVLLPVVLFAPNALASTSRSDTLSGPRLRWVPSTLWATLTALALVTSLMSVHHVERFVYFQF
jgi:alginate O-acetyltransferase complex protein AlgI